MWLLLALVVVVDAVWISFSDFSLELVDALFVIGAGGVAFLVGAVYRWLRPAPPLAACCSAAAYLIWFTSAAAVLSYLCASVVLPFQDSAFIAFDEALGLDWRAHLTWVIERPSLMYVLNVAYFSLNIQVPLLLVWLAFRDREALNRYLGLYAVTAIAVILTALVVPAIGAHTVTPLPPETLAGLPHPLAGRYHVEPLMALREGGLRHIALRSAEGLVTFPSFHTALAIVLAYGFARIPFMAPPMLVLNGLVVVSTISIGGHYLADVVSGGALALCAIAACSVRARRAFSLRQRTAAPRALQEAPANLLDPVGRQS